MRGSRYPLRYPLQLGTVNHAVFDHGHELRTGLLVNLDAGIERVNSPPIRPALGR